MATDIIEFKINYGDKKLYLSPIMDLFNGEILSFNTSTSSTVKFTTDALDEALKRLPENHSLTGCFFYSSTNATALIDGNKEAGILIDYIMVSKFF